MGCVGCSFDSFSVFAQFKTTKSHENDVFQYPFSSMAISPQNIYLPIYIQEFFTFEPNMGGGGVLRIIHF